MHVVYEVSFEEVYPNVPSETSVTFAAKLERNYLIVASDTVEQAICKAKAYLLKSELGHHFKVVEVRRLLTVDLI